MVTDKVLRVAKKMFKPGGALKKDGMHRPEGAGNFSNAEDVLDDVQEIITPFIEAEAIEINHTHETGDVHEALKINVDAAGFGDVKALDIVYSTGAISAGQDEEAILINIDQTLATSGDVNAVEVLTTEGSAVVHGLEVGAQVGPIDQISGVFEDMDKV